MTRLATRTQRPTPRSARGTARNARPAGQGSLLDLDPRTTPAVPQQRLLDGDPLRGATLEDVISGAWEGLTAHGAVACPVCRGAMAPRYGAGAAAVGGRCGDCGSQLS
jgi:hypothetical protein